MQKSGGDSLDASEFWPQNLVSKSALSDLVFSHNISWFIYETELHDGIMKTEMQPYVIFPWRRLSTYINMNISRWHTRSCAETLLFPHGSKLDLHMYYELCSHESWGHTEYTIFNLFFLKQEGNFNFFTNESWCFCVLTWLWALQLLIRPQNIIELMINSRALATVKKIMKQIPIIKNITFLKQVFMKRDLMFLFILQFSLKLIFHYTQAGCFDLTLCVPKNLSMADSHSASSSRDHNRWQNVRESSVSANGNSCWVYQNVNASSCSFNLFCSCYSDITELQQIFHFHL